VIPYDLVERYIKTQNEATDVYCNNSSGKNCELYEAIQLHNAFGTLDGNVFTADKDKYFIREYSQNSVSAVTPYSSNNVKDGTENGYFIKCNVTSDLPVGTCLRAWYPGGSGCDKLGVIKATDTHTIFNRCDGTTMLEQRIRSYIDDISKYTYMDVNYEFLRRLKLNSRALWRHKGTLEGLEMILGMFGLKSKRWMERNKSCRYNGYKSRCCKENNRCKCTENYDYEIIEYTQFTTRLTDEWDYQLNNFKYDWLNSTKTITYDYRSVSNYTKPGAMGMTYVPYQGIPVSYRNPYGEDELTSKTRYLYPNFNKSEQLDGNPYFQMDGGWLAKSVNNEHNFQFDVDDNIVYNKIEKNPRSDNGFIIDNHKLYKETVRSIKRVEDLNELISLPQQDLYDGIICFVGKVSSEVAVIDGGVFDIEKDTDGQFIRFTLKGGYIQVGDLYFSESIVVYDETFDPTVYILDDKFDGYEVKAYINESNNFICYSNENSNYGITSFKMIKEDNSDTYSNYYVLDDTVFSHSISHGYNSNGWRRLAKTDPDYLKINTVENYYEGNNGHNGNLHYDSGHEYFTYFQRLFKYAEDNGLFDTRCYREGFDDVYREVHNIGFSGLIHDVEDIKDYDKFLISGDTKVHYFGNVKKAKWNLVLKDTGKVVGTYDSSTKAENERLKKEKRDGNYGTRTYNVESPIDTIHIYGDSAKYKDKYNNDAWSDFYGKSPSYYSIAKSDNNKLSNDIDKYYKYENLPTDVKSKITKADIDDVTNQIVNNKRIKIIFYMKSCSFASKDGQIELKYMDKIVMNYLTQMLPSTVITDIEYNFCNYNYKGC
jgi:hypothetical protein